MKCKLCERDTSPPLPETTATGVCEECRKKLGIVSLPPSRRQPRPCAHCSGMRFVRSVPRELTATGSDYVNQEVAPMTATLVPATSPKLLFSGRSVEDAGVHHGAGRLEIYICVRCGLVEWHCMDPERIPIGPEFMTEMIDLAPESPYRG